MNSAIIANLNQLNLDLIAFVEQKLDTLADELYQLLLQSRQPFIGTDFGTTFSALEAGPPPILKPSVATLEASFREMERRAPHAWPIFKRALDEGTREYQGFPVGHCSVEGAVEAERFGLFLRRYLRGFVLDVGCGPQPVPVYLRDCPLERICGIDPISTAKDHPFLFMPAVCEDIPWQDGSFDVVCSGTTLDHFFLLDVALHEIRRVLRPGGFFVAWISEIPGSPRYDPYLENIQPADQEHLFHIDREWFLPVMADSGFKPIEILAFSRPFKYLYMAFQKPE